MEQTNSVDRWALDTSGQESVTDWLSIGGSQIYG